jgi:hypothetical protein
MIYLIEGYAGEYDYYHNWIVKAFVDKEKAEHFVSLCLAEAERVCPIQIALNVKYQKDTHGLSYNDNKDYIDGLAIEYRRQELLNLHRHDPKFDDYGEKYGYRIKDCELVE